MERFRAAGIRRRAGQVRVGCRPQLHARTVRRDNGSDRFDGFLGDRAEIAGVIEVVGEMPIFQHL